MRWRCTSKRRFQCALFANRHPSVTVTHGAFDRSVDLGRVDVPRELASGNVRRLERFDPFKRFMLAAAVDNNFCGANPASLPKLNLGISCADIGMSRIVELYWP